MTQNISTFLFAALLYAGPLASLFAAETLYGRIGGENTLKAVVITLLDDASSDPRTSRSFKDVKLSVLKESLYAQLCFLTGGGCTYEGETMKNAHADLAITQAEFELMVQMLRDALSRHGVGEREKNEVLKMLAPMRRDIVTGPAATQKSTAK